MWQRWDANPRLRRDWCLKPLAFLVPPLSGFFPTCLTGVNLSALLVCLLLLYLCAMVSPKAQFLAPFCTFCTTLQCIQLRLFMECLTTYTRTTISSTRDSGSVTAPTKLVPSPLSPPALARPNSGPRPIV